MRQVRQAHTHTPRHSERRDVSTATHSAVFCPGCLQSPEPTDSTSKLQRSPSVPLSAKFNRAQRQRFNNAVTTFQQRFRVIKYTEAVTRTVCASSAAFFSFSCCHCLELLRSLLPPSSSRNDISTVHSLNEDLLHTACSIMCCLMCVCVLYVTC